MEDFWVRFLVYFAIHTQGLSQRETSQPIMVVGFGIILSAITLVIRY